MTIGIKRLFFLTSFFSAVIPMLLVGVVSLYLITNHLRDEMVREGMHFSLAISTQIRNYLREPVRVLSLERNYIEGQQYSDSRTERFFDDVLRSHEYFESIYWLNRSGIVQQVSSRSKAGINDLRGIDFSTQDSFRDAIKNNRASWSNSQTLTYGEPNISLCVPCRNGVILASLKLVDLSRIINEASSNSYYTAFVVEKGGRIIVHPDSSVVTRRENIGDLPLMGDEVKNIVSGKLDFQNIHYHATVVPIPETQWKLVVAKRLELTERPVLYLENTFFFGVGIMLVLTSCFAFVGNRIVSRPFRKINEQSRLVSEGRFNEIVPVDSICSDIVLLSETINTMAAEVQKRELILHDQNEELSLSEEMLRAQIDEYIETHDQLLATEEMLRVQLKESESNQKLLSESSNKLETMIDASPLAIISLDHSGRISFWNRAAATLFGCAVDDICRTLKPLFHTDADYDVFLNRLVLERKLFLPEQRFHSIEGRPLVASVVTAPISSSTSESNFIIMLEDITKRAQLEEQLRHTQKLEILGQLAGGIAHDFNNMLAAIMSASELLQFRLAGDEKNIRMADIIHNAATRSATLTQDLLAFSRKGKIENRPVDINQMIVVVLGLLERTVDKRIKITTHLDAENSTVIGDPTLLQNALLNLGVNARDAMPEGGTLTYATSMVVLDSASCKYNQTDVSPGIYLQVSVSDSGVGIPKEIIKRIYEPFFTTKEAGKGTGLGLSAVYGTVREHGGGISVYSEPGQGTVFNIVLPLLINGKETVELREMAIRGTGGILLVDDEELIRSMGHDLLEELGYTIFLAEDGEQALEFYRKHRDKISLVILDMIMPKLGGKETCQKLLEKDPNARVLFCSGFHREGTVEELVKYGAKGFIKKPFSMIDLSRAVKKALE